MPHQEAVRARDDAHRLADDLRSTVRSVTAPNDNDRLDYEVTQRIAELLEQLRDLLAERGAP